MGIIKDWIYEICCSACDDAIQRQSFRTGDDMAKLAHLIIDVHQGTVSIESVKFLQEKNINPNCLRNVRKPQNSNFKQ